MTIKNREIAIDFLDSAVTADGVAVVGQKVKRALSKDKNTQLTFNTFELAVDPLRQTVTLLQDWFACEPEVFSAHEIIEVIKSSRQRERDAKRR